MTRLNKLDAEDGYLTDEYLDYLRDTKFESAEDAGRFMVHELPVICEHIACMHLDLDDDRDEWTDEPVKIIRFITGGWSGAEDLIGVMLGHFWIKHFHKEWKRGGLFVFEVPERFYAARPASPKESDQ